MKTHLILVSESPRRRQLVTQLGLPFKAVAPNCSEELNPTLPLIDQIIDVAKRKAESVTVADAVWILAADTVVELNGEILGKPHTSETATKMLQALSQNTCQVITGYALHHIPTNRQILNAVTTRVAFHALTMSQINAYVATGEPLDKAGAFAIQGLGRTLIAEIEGDFDNVVGLPIAAIRESMKNLRPD